MVELLFIERVFIEDTDDKHLQKSCILSAIGLSFNLYGNLR